MLQANVLRLGNFIASGVSFKDTSVIGKVLEVGNTDREFEQIYYESEESFGWFFKDNYCGIPITNERLERFGFTKSLLGSDVCHTLEYKRKLINEPKPKYQIILINFGIVSEKEKGRYSVAIREIERDTQFGVSNLEFVHELQNFYFSLTEKELEISYEQI